MWEGISAILTLIVLVIKAWLDNEKAKDDKFNATKKEISDAVNSGNISAINYLVNKLRR